MNGKKFYAVANGRKPGIYKTWEECKAQVDGFSNAKYKSFSSETEAKAFMKEFGPTHPNATKVCVLCERPNASRTELCMGCQRKKKALEAKYAKTSNGKFKGITNKALVFLKTKHEGIDIFDYLNQNPKAIWEAYSVSKEVRTSLKRERKEYFRDNQTYAESEVIPDFVTKLLGPTKEAIRVYGERLNPSIIYRCKLCQETLYTKFNDYLERSGHDCSGIKSSGELIVEEFLKKNNIPFKSQRDTLQCKNPDTGSVMPYDFELTNKKILIEVQGEQHAKFIPRFHVTEEGFEYQKKKDQLKRNFAEQNGYRLIELWYEELKEEYLKKVILEAIKDEREYHDTRRKSAG